MLCSVIHRLMWEPCISRRINHRFVQAAPELTWLRSEKEALQAILNSIEMDDRWELSVWDGPTLLGVAIAKEDQDDHVGPCLSVQWRFVLPEAEGLAGRKLQRGLVRLARGLGFKVLAYTKRTGNARYELKYLRLR